MAGGQHQVEGVFSRCGFEALQEVFDVAVQLKDHLADEGRIAADLEAALNERNL